jgi:hypothetical protein
VATLSVVVDPDVEIGAVQDERGRAIVTPFHDALVAAMSDAGFHVVPATAPHDLTVHVKLARIGFNYGAWGDGVVVQLSGSNQVVTQVTRPSLNFVHLEGADTPARLTFAAHMVVNAFNRDRKVADYAASHPPSVAPAPTSVPLPGASPASAAR